MRELEVPMADKNKQYKSVSDFVRGLSDDEEFNKELEERISERMVVKTLHAMRTAKGVSQAEIAEELDCSQSRVSKIENGFDGDLKVSELEAYAKALDLDVHLSFVERGATGMDLVKHHAFCIQSQLIRMAELAAEDNAIAEGVAMSFAETLFNQVNLLRLAAERLPPTPDNEHYIKIDVRAELNHHSDDCPTDVDPPRRFALNGDSIRRNGRTPVL